MARKTRMQREQGTRARTRGPSGGRAPTAGVDSLEPMRPEGAEDEAPVANLPPAATLAGRQLIARAMSYAAHREASVDASALTAVGLGGENQFNLHGKTKARFDGGRYQVENLVTEPVEGCERCGRRDCMHATGTLTAAYRVATTVTLPPVPTRPRLTPCQREAVQRFIATVLGPHEQDHVAAFEQYNGTTETSFDLTICRPRLQPTLQRMFRAEERKRRAEAKRASKALDPFVREIEGLDCSDDS